MNWGVILRVLLDISFLVVFGVGCYVIGLKRGFKVGANLILKKMEDSIQKSQDSE